MKYLLAAASVIALSACTTDNDVYRSYFSEAGALVDNGDFGNANMNNHLVMTGEKAYVYDLANRFSQEVMSTVNFAFIPGVIEHLTFDGLT